MGILEVNDLQLYYRTSRGPVKAVDHISFNLDKGETLAMVGESGCGKTSTASAILRILPRNVHRYTGEVFLDGTDIMAYSDEDFRRNVRWKGISVVFQGAMNALSPTMKVGRQIYEPLQVHMELEKEEALERAQTALAHVGLPEMTGDRYAHELSGGMKQRVVIAMALILRPQVVILDEPTSALDVMTQANIINLLKQLKKEEDLSYIFITHDLALASELADHVAIMYAGRMAEIGTAEEIYRDPQHPYTVLLLGSVPLLRATRQPETIPGAPPDLINPPRGCRFRPRCPYAFEKCIEQPPLDWGKRLAACWLQESGGIPIGKRREKSPPA
ncbi:MAG: ABC transporter ATP-binding protein [Thermoplasmata archaeon]